MVGREDAVAIRRMSGLGSFGSVACSDDANAVWKLTGVALLSVVALGCLHALLYHLHAILVPFVLSGFIVLALQPAVEATYAFLSGRRPPYRWCVCGCVRRCKADYSDVEKVGAFAHSGEGKPLLGLATESFWTKALDGVMRLVAVLFILSLMIFCVCCICFVLTKGAVHMKDDWAAYQAGYYRLGSRLDKMLESMSKELKISQASDEQLREVYNTILNKSQDYVLDMVNAIVSGLSGGLTNGAIMLLYVMFWLLEPLPTGGKLAGALVRSYLYKKTFVSFLYGLCVALLFLLLGIDLAMLFGMIGFFLNFLPEVGAIICTLIPIPVILLDGRIEYPIQVLIASIVGQLFLKFIFGNILEVKLIERDKEMSIHPVWVILGLCYFGFVWGPVGMLISVPMLAMMKTAAMSVKETLVEGDQDTMSLADTFLACFEGRAGRQSRLSESLPSHQSLTPRRPPEQEALLT